VDNPSGYPQRQPTANDNNNDNDNDNDNNNNNNNNTLETMCWRRLDTPQGNDLVAAVK